MSGTRSRFWQEKSLRDLTMKEWEKLCDRCGRCCLRKLEDEDTEEIFYTGVACRFLDIARCECRRYEDRTELAADCLVLTPANAACLDLLPSTCAYRRLAKGKPLPEWHPLECGHHEKMNRAGIPVRGKVLSEDHVDPKELPAFIIFWVEHDATGRENS